MLTAAEKIGYGVATAARVGWYLGHYVAGLRRLEPLPKPEFPVGPTPDRARLLAAMRELFERDLANIDRGLYAMPDDLLPDPRALLRRSALYFQDLPAVDRRRHARVAQEPDADPRNAGLPRYYRQNFHFQSDGWLSERSAELYDTQVEVLFTGAADAMRRQALVPLAAHFAGRDTRRAAALDVGCGTGRLLAAMHATWPGLRLAGTDLSPPYLAHARRQLGPSARIRLAEGAAEALPFPDGAFDAVTAVFLLHELPKKIRAAFAAEAARVLAPGGRLVVVDTLQKGDRPDWDGLLDLFPHHFHEPYYAEYVASDLAAPFLAAGLAPAGTELAFLSKVAVFDKPA